MRDKRLMKIWLVNLGLYIRDQSIGEFQRVRFSPERQFDFWMIFHGQVDIFANNS